MALHSQSFDNKKKTTLNIFNKNHKIDYYRKMQSYSQLDRVPVKS